MSFPLRAALFRIEPERAHGLTIAALGLAGRSPLRRGPVRADRLAVRVAGIDFANPLGVAAGVDKDARAASGLLGLGFGGVEVGTLTPLPQPGNPRPRVFRLVEDRGLVNRLGFNNSGITGGVARVAAARARGLKGGRIGINVGANKDATDRVADYRAGVAAAAPHADWVTVNISSPNTPGLRDLQRGAALTELLSACDAARRIGTRRVPLFLKVAPDQSPAETEAIAAAAMAGGVDALVVGNTTVSRPATLRDARGAEAGGLSGAPLRSLAAERLADFARATGGALPLVAAGGVDSGAEAYARLRAGASLVQLYTAMVYEGPGLARRVLADLDALLARDGFASAGEAVGADRG